MALAKILRSFASLFGMSAAALCWVIGFRVTQSQSAISTTLALLIGLGGIGLVYERYWRRSWILAAVALPLGFYFNSTSRYFPLPGVLLAVCLLLVAFSSLVTRAALTRGNPDEGGEGAQQDKQ